MAACAIATVLLYSCNGSGISPEEQQARNKAEKTLSYLKNDIMKQYYYWYTSVPDLSYTWQTDVFKFFDDLLWEGDRWSWMMDGQEYIDYESGVLSGTFGCSMSQPISDNSGFWGDDYNVVVRYVYPNSPFDKAGAKRGWVVSALNGKSTLDYYLAPDPETVSDAEAEARADEFNEILNYPNPAVPITFTFTTPEGETVQKSIAAAATLNTRPGLIKKIFSAEDYPGLTQKVGYFHYLAFQADEAADGTSMLNDITDAMDYFKENNVKTLILDLRYNGGGDSRASNLLVSYLAPSSALGKVYVKRTHNSKLSSQDEETKVESPAAVIASLEKEKISLIHKPDSPGFENLYFITGRGSASASEMALNGLKPISNLHHVGLVTYGKPNGMYVFLYPYSATDRRNYNNGNYRALEYVFLPICFYNENGIGQNIPDNGLTPDYRCPDDLYHDFDAGEMNIAACLHHLVHGTYPVYEPVSPKARQATFARRKVGRLHIPEDNDKNYGRYVVKPDFL